MNRTCRIILAGNPNSGKSSLFNAFTGLNQKVGNFPGVTVDKKTGQVLLPGGLKAEITDLPGAYSLYPRAADEQIAAGVLLQSDPPDLVVITVDASSLERNLVLCSQITDLGMPVLVALTMTDIARQKGIKVQTDVLAQQLGVPVIVVNPRRNEGIDALKKAIAGICSDRQQQQPPLFTDTGIFPAPLIEAIKSFIPTAGDYMAWHIACGYETSASLSSIQKKYIAGIYRNHAISKAAIQAREIMERYRKIDRIISLCVTKEEQEKQVSVTDRMDRVLLHPLWGNVILLGVLFLMFQSIFWLAQYPMDWIDTGFGAMTGWLANNLPAGIGSDLLVNGLLAGIGGIVIFIPQIMILFGLITLLEDTGYMARVSFLTDRIMRSVGLNGRSVMPLMSGLACAIPAIMSARSIPNRKERLITIMVTPLMACAARLPVYTILIALVIPERTLLDFISLQGLVLMGLYLLGLVMALLAAGVMKLLIRSRERSFFVMELPVYRMPRWKNAGITMMEKARIFVTQAGKIILTISLLLWVFASFGPPGAMKSVDEKYAQLRQQYPEQSEALGLQHQSEKLEHSFIGIFGRAIEPAIRPLGYDWKIGIALVTSFAAREVFVGTMATLYSVGDGENQERTVREKMKMATWPDGRPVYNLATGLSLLVFYAFAMQCMSTLAIVKRETGGWKHPLIQFAYMLALAWIGAFITYSLAS